MIWKILVIWIKNINTQEMLRNQSREKNHKIILISPEPSNYNQSSHLILKPQQPTQFVPLEKTRTFSHKKLSLTSTLSSPQANQSMRKVMMPTFEVNKFYRPATKGNLLMQSKKVSIEESKISLKLSSTSNIDIGTPEKKQGNYCTQNGRNSVGSSTGENQRIKLEIQEFMNSRLNMLNNQITTQNLTIHNLKQRIQCLQIEIRNKNQLICNLLNQKPQPQQTQPPSKYPQIEARLSDIERVQTIMGSQSNKAQNSLNYKLDTLTRQLVQMNITSQSKQIAKIKYTLSSMWGKIQQWLQQKQTKMQKMQEYCIGLQGKTSGIEEVKGNIRMLGYRIEKLEQAELQKSFSLRNMETKDSIQCWDTFQDYVVSNRSSHQLRNNSIFSQDDYFFHPDHPTPRLKQSIISCLSTSSAFSSQFPPPQTPACSQSSPFTQLISIMQQLKQQPAPLPIACQLDQHNRLLTKPTNRLLQNKHTQDYYKLGNQQVQILINRGYIVLQL